MRIYSADELEVCEEVGRGAFGVVYRGLVKATNDEVAIKQIDLENEQADLMEVNKEIQIISECRISQITKFLGCFVKNYKLWVIMEYVNGGSLFDLLRPGPVTDESTISAIVQQILIALNYLHSQGKIHRDLKSQNILLSREGEVKLTDFGVSTQLSSNFSRRNTTVGTPYWMAPEVILNNNGGHSYKADIWSLGCCAFELFNGKPPLQNQYPPMKALRQISRCYDDSDFTDLIGLDQLQISNSFKDFLRQCFIIDPKERSSSKKLLKHKFITSHKGDHIKELKKLIINKQLWDQEHHVPKVHNFYVPTEIQKNQQKWDDSNNEKMKTIHFDLSQIDSGDEREELPDFLSSMSKSEISAKTNSQENISSPIPKNNKVKANNGSQPQLNYHSFSKTNTKQENLKKMLKPELTKIVNKVFQKIETKNNLLTEQYDSIVALNDAIVNLVCFIQDNQSDKSPKVLICLYLRYFFKEILKENASEARSVLQKLVVPSALDKRSTNTTTIDRNTSVSIRKSGKMTHFDEIEDSLIESWVSKMTEKNALN